MRKKVQPRKQEPLRKHGAETGSQQRTQPPPRESTQSPSGIRRKVILTNLSQDTPAGTSQRTQTGHSDSRSDKTYEGFIDKSRKTLRILRMMMATATITPGPPTVRALTTAPPQVNQTLRSLSPQAANAYA